MRQHNLEIRQRFTVVNAMKQLLTALFFLLTSHSSPQAQTSFYQGKTITLVVGTSAGGLYDRYARLLAEPWSKHIPGNPSIVVQNMAGAGSVIAANHVYNVAKPDGLTILSIVPAIYFNQLVGRQEVRFDWLKFNWIGSPDRSSNLLYMRTDTPFKTIYDVRRATQPPKCSASGTGTVGHYTPTLLNQTIGTKFELVLGYPGAPEMDLAVEKNETQCRALSVDSFFAGEPYLTWRNKGFVRVLVQTGRTRDERLAQIPTLGELMDEFKTEDVGRRLATAVLSSAEFGRPYMLPHGIPPERLKLLRESFVKTVADPGLLEEAKRRNLDVRPSTGEELEKLAKEVMVQPVEVIERMKRLVGL
jgi:tripartite-type tricarboxylate transporter receptor subunit TctC